MPVKWLQYLNASAGIAFTLLPINNVEKLLHSDNPAEEAIYLQLSALKDTEDIELQL